MTLLEATLWALAGGGLTEVYDYYKDIRARGALPWNKRLSKRRDRKRPTPGIYATATTLRLAMAGGVGAAFGASGQVTTPYVAVGLGLGAMALIERATKGGALQPTSGNTGFVGSERTDVAQIEHRFADDPEPTEPTDRDAR